MTYEPSIPLGSYRLLLWRRSLTLPLSELRCHAHVLGKTGSGKSYFLAGLYLALHRAGQAVTLIDPHGDLADLVLAHLVAGGDLDTPAKRRRLLSLNLPRAETADVFLPFNVLAQPYTDHAMAEQVAEAARRAWPELSRGAPTFENILKHSVIALRQAGQPLSGLSRLLTDHDFREHVLAQGTDEQVLRFFHGRLDAWGRDGPAMKESTLNRADLLTLSPLLRDSLGAADTALPIRRLLDVQTSVLVNLAVPYPDARRLLGCLLTVGLEAAALSRADVPPGHRAGHHLMIDEFSQFMAQSEESLTRMLSETRKYNLFCVMAHQNWSQASDRLKGALQNVGLEVILKAGRMDAEYSARLLAAVDPMRVKHTVDDAAAVERTHPTFFPLLEQWERHTQAIQTLKVGQAFLRLPDDSVHRVTTPTLPAVTVSSEQLTGVRESYLRRYFRPVPPAAPAITTTPEVPTPGSPPIRRYHPDDLTEPNPAPVPAAARKTPPAVFAPPRRIRRPR